MLNFIKLSRLPSEDIPPSGVKKKVTNSGVLYEKEKFCNLFLCRDANGSRGDLTISGFAGKTGRREKQGGR